MHCRIVEADRKRHPFLFPDTGSRRRINVGWISNFRKILMSITELYISVKQGEIRKMEIVLPLPGNFIGHSTQCQRQLPTEATTCPTPPDSSYQAPKFAS